MKAHRIEKLEATRGYYYVRCRCQWCAGIGYGNAAKGRIPPHAEMLAEAKRRFRHHLKEVGVQK